MSALDYAEEMDIAEPMRFFYMINPIDWWRGWTPFEEEIAKDSDAVIAGDSDAVREANELHRARRAAEKSFLSLGWEGDSAGGWWCSGLPSGDSCELAYVLAVKQENNGTTFIASPYELPWLEELSYDWCGGDGSMMTPQARSSSR